LPHKTGSKKSMTIYFICIDKKQNYDNEKC
jgi:hypothetical protein